MIPRVAAAMSLVVFMVCLLAGMAADNPFSTIIVRALLAMAATMVIGLVVGSMAQKMLDENIAAEEQKFKKSAAFPTEDGR